MRETKKVLERANIEPQPCNNTTQTLEKHMNKLKRVRKKNRTKITKNLEGKKEQNKQEKNERNKKTERKKKKNSLGVKNAVPRGKHRASV